jgi:hypothetical protein
VTLTVCDNRVAAFDRVDAKPSRGGIPLTQNCRIPPACLTKNRIDKGVGDPRTARKRKARSSNHHYHSCVLDLCGCCFRRRTKLTVNRRLSWGCTAPTES